jgi:hypothetical protein
MAFVRVRWVCVCEICGAQNKKSVERVRRLQNVGGLF